MIAGGFVCLAVEQPLDVHEHLFAVFRLFEQAVEVGGGEGFERVVGDSEDDRVADRGDSRRTSRRAY